MEQPAAWFGGQRFLTGILDQTNVAGVLCCEEVVTGILHCAAVDIEASAVQVVAIHPRPAEQSSIVSSILSEVPPKSSSGATPPVSSTVMIQSDNMSMQMTSNKLDGTNYSAWSQFVQLYVTRKGKLGYLIGEKIKPAISDPSFSTWVEENAMLMSWLLNSMTPDINASFLRLPTAHDIWDVVAQTYFTGNDASQIYGIKA
uniref:Retrotransposon Copia-like N-terminal domain-containing protein n=1 Tax=Fagus sylvatica TaxID=28930 RepID=A0A2N9EJH9_FAGSY